MGHSIKINLDNYTFEEEDYVSNTLDKLNSLGTTRDYQNKIKKTPRNHCF